MNSQQDDREQRIQKIVRECLQQWASGLVFDEIAIVDANLDLAPELGAELLKLRLLGRAAGDAEEAKQFASPQTLVHPSGLKVRCPHCRNPLEIVDDVDGDADDSMEMQCDSCGGEISIASDPTSTQQPNPKLGCFVLQELLGRGAFGSVWRAYDEELDRDVAVKVPRRNQLDPSQAGQFLREARITAQLAHPNIVSVHEIGREGETVYIVSDLVQGVPLSQRMQGRTKTNKDAAALCETLARALQHAHDQGVIHRDLKPANIMIDEQDQPRIMDFGLAKRETGEITMTADGQVLGTPAYMSPEQAAGDSHRVDGRSDVYSLGVILYELLTGEIPFRGSVRMLIQQVIHDDPPSPRRLAGSVPADLETIVLKCLAKERSSRYASAQKLADDLQRFLRGEPIMARPISRVDRVWRWSKRNPMAATVIGLVSFLAVAAPAYAWHEKDQRVRLEQLVEEKDNVIRRLDTQSKERDAERAIANRSFSPSQESEWNLHNTPMALIAAEKYGQGEEPATPRGLIAKGNFDAASQRTEDAIAAWRQAIKLLEQSTAANDQLAFSDCCLRLGELYFAKDASEAIVFINKAITRLQQLQNDSPSLTTHALLHRSRVMLGVAFTKTKRRKEGLALIAESAARNSAFQSALPDSPSDAYEFSHWFFTSVPPLLSDLPE